MTDLRVPPPLSGPRPCPRCGGNLTEPVSGDVHCYRECTSCGTRFEMDDPELAGSVA